MRRATWQCDSCHTVHDDARKVNTVTVAKLWWVVCNDCLDTVGSHARIEPMVEYRERVDAHD